MKGLCFVREKTGLSTKEIGELVGVPQQFVSMWALGKKKIPPERLEKLSEITGVSEKFFLKPELTEMDKCEIILEIAIKKKSEAIQQLFNMKCANWIDGKEIMIQTNENLENLDKAIFVRIKEDSESAYRRGLHECNTILQSVAEIILSEGDEKRKLCEYLKLVKEHSEGGKIIKGWSKEFRGGDKL